jgi:uncharacterized protein (TIGR02246 family)
MARGVELREMHPTFERGYNDRDLDAVMALYGPETTMTLMDGGTVRGVEAIRGSLAALFGVPDARMAVRTRYVIEAGDLALLSSEWTMTAGDQVMSAVTAEVAQRQPDGGWRYLIDHPYASMETAEAGAAAGTGSAST